MKYRAKRQCLCLECGGRAVTFGSKAEAGYYFGELKPAEEHGRIQDLQVHPVFLFEGDVKHISDFAFRTLDEKNRLVWVVQDVKGKGAPLTAVFKRFQRLVAGRRWAWDALSSRFVPRGNGQEIKIDVVER